MVEGDEAWREGFGENGTKGELGGCSDMAGRRIRLGGYSWFVGDIGGLEGLWNGRAEEELRCPWSSG